MTVAADSLSPRQRDCLRLVWERQAMSKEIALELGISKATVDGYIAEAVKALGARDRRQAAAMAFGGSPRQPAASAPVRAELATMLAAPAVSGGDPARVSGGSLAGADGSRSTGFSMMAPPWRTTRHPRNSLFFGPTIGWIAIIAIGSLATLALATSVGNGLPSVAKPAIEAVRRLTR